MMFEMPKYEVRYFDRSEWQDISEMDLMRSLVKFYDRVTPAIQQIIECQQVLTQYAFYRLKRRNVSQLGNPGASAHP